MADRMSNQDLISGVVNKGYSTSEGDAFIYKIISLRVYRFLGRMYKAWNQKMVYAREYGDKFKNLNGYLTPPSKISKNLHLTQKDTPSDSANSDISSKTTQIDTPDSTHTIHYNPDINNYDSNLSKKEIIKYIRNTTFSIYEIRLIGKETYEFVQNMVNFGVFVLEGYMQHGGKLYARYKFTDKGKMMYLHLKEFIEKYGD